MSSKEPRLTSCARSSGTQRWNSSNVLRRLKTPVLVIQVLRRHNWLSYLQNLIIYEWPFKITMHFWHRWAFRLGLGSGICLAYPGLVALFKRLTSRMCLALGRKCELNVDSWLVKKRVEMKRRIQLSQLSKMAKPIDNAVYVFYVSPSLHIPRGNDECSVRNNSLFVMNRTIEEQLHQGTSFGVQNRSLSPSIGSG
mmetsp:Transcript_112/g.193  ORF Transcript_112/g.193 Transcript_112/m.193 type:complete len:196 (-) Transcript_112:154-741(-)